MLKSLHNNVKYKKTAKGKIIKLIEEQYIRTDLPCGFAACPFCDANPRCVLALNPLDAAEEQLLSAQPNSAELQGIAAPSTAAEGNPMRSALTTNLLFVVDTPFAQHQTDLIENFDSLCNVVLPQSVLTELSAKAP